MSPSRQRAVIACLAATIVMTWPFASPAAFGRGLYVGDTQLIVWTLGWANTAVIDGLPLFRANIYFPAPDSLQYNEHLFGLSLFTLP